MVARACVIAFTGFLAYMALLTERNAGQMAWAEPREPRLAAATGKKTLRPGDIDVARSRIFVHVGKTGFGHEHAIEGRVRGGHVQLADPAHVGKIEIDMQSFAADTIEARNYVGLKGTLDRSTQEQVQANMLGSKCLDVEQFPTATFAMRTASRMKDVPAGGKPRYRIEGDFSLHGVSRPLALVAQVEQERGEFLLRGKFTIMQTNFGIKPYTAALGAVGVADQLTIWGDLWITGE